MAERTTVNCISCVRAQDGTEWYATEEDGVSAETVEGVRHALHGEDLRWLLSPEARGESPNPQSPSSPASSAMGDRAAASPGERAFLAYRAHIDKRRDYAVYAQTWTQLSDLERSAWEAVASDPSLNVQPEPSRDSGPPDCLNCGYPVSCPCGNARISVPSQPTSLDGAAALRALEKDFWEEAKRAADNGDLRRENTWTEAAHRVAVLLPPPPKPRRDRERA